MFEDSRKIEILFRGGPGYPICHQNPLIKYIPAETQKIIKFCLPLPNVQCVHPLSLKTISQQQHRQGGTLILVLNQDAEEPTKTKAIADIY